MNCYRQRERGSAKVRREREKKQRPSEKGGEKRQIRRGRGRGWEAEEQRDKTVC